MDKISGLEYEMQGDGEPVLVIHGSHVADAFVPLAKEPAIADAYRVIRYHRRGFAGSDRHTGPFGIEDQGRDALTLLRTLNVHRAHVVGQSYGAVIALELASAEPAVVHSLVLLEPPVTTEPLEGAEVFEPLMTMYASGDTRGAVDAFMKLVCGPDWRAEVARVVPGGPEQAEADAATFFEIEMPGLAPWALGPDKASRVTQPALFVLGRDSGPMFTSAQQKFLNAFPDAEIATVAGLNHLLQMRDSQRVAEPVSDFLRRHPM
jgi:pimeloyl-ACP methyl ester carboxylesterase